MILQHYHNSTTVVLQYYSSTTVVLLQYYSSIAVVLQYYNRNFSWGAGCLIPLGAHSPQPNLSPWCFLSGGVLGCLNPPGVNTLKVEVNIRRPLGFGVCKKEGATSVASRGGRGFPGHSAPGRARPCQASPGLPRPPQATPD